MLSSSDYIGTPYAREDVALSSSAISPTASIYRPNNDTRPRAARVTVEAASGTDGMRYCEDGTTPVDATPVGDLWLGTANECMILRGEAAIKSFKAVLHGTTAKVHFTYYR